MVGKPLTREHTVNCPKCNYPDGPGDQRFKGIYTPGKKCDGCSFVDPAPPPLCERCKINPPAYPGARFCGAACAAQYEAKR